VFDDTVLRYPVAGLDKQLTLPRIETQVTLPTELYRLTSLTYKILSSCVLPFLRVALLLGDHSRILTVQKRHSSTAVSFLDNRLMHKAKNRGSTAAKNTGQRKYTCIGVLS